MLVPGAREPLVYFAYPKCGSEFMRAKLHLFWDNNFDPYNWDVCSMFYCHCRPQRFLRLHGPGPCTMFSVVRNPFERVVSLWAYGSRHKLPFAQDRSFSRFVEHIYDCRNADIGATPMAWMHMSAHQYFGDLMNEVHIFKLENLQACLDWLTEQHGLAVRNDGKINQTPLDQHYSLYYDEKSRWMVARLFQDDLQRFGYRFESGKNASRPRSRAAHAGRGRATSRRTP
jgi:hypothetical protein